jgi:hypothetical protein
MLAGRDPGSRGLADLGRYWRYRAIFSLNEDLRRQEEGDKEHDED